MIGASLQFSGSSPNPSLRFKVASRTLHDPEICSVNFYDAKGSHALLGDSAIRGDFFANIVTAIG